MTQFHRRRLTELMQEPRDTLAEAIEQDRVAFQPVPPSLTSWRSMAMRLIEDLPGGTFTGEDIRLKITAAHGEPRHPNCWGALINTAVKRGLLVDTGETSPMFSSTAHSRRTPIWRRRAL